MVASAHMRALHTRVATLAVMTSGARFGALRSSMMPGEGPAMSSLVLGRVLHITPRGEAVASLNRDVPIALSGSARMEPPFVRIGTLVTDDPSRPPVARIADVIGPVASPLLVLEPPRGRDFPPEMAGTDVYLANRTPPSRGPPGRGAPRGAGRPQDRSRGPSGPGYGHGASRGGDSRGGGRPQGRDTGRSGPPTQDRGTRKGVRRW